MSKNNYKAEIESNALQSPQRVAFITRKTSAKVKGETSKQLMAYPHLILREAITFQVLTILLVVVALLWNAPLEQLANPLLTPNPAKAPWYFLGLQELLHYFPPFVAGVIMPTLVVIALVVIPYFNINTKDEPLWSANRSKRFVIFLFTTIFLLGFLWVFQAWTVIAPTILIASFIVFSYLFSSSELRAAKYLQTKPLRWWVMTWFIAVAVVLTAVGTFFRGPGWSWIWPWR